MHRGSKKHFYKYSKYSVKTRNRLAVIQSIFLFLFTKNKIIKRTIHSKKASSKGEGEVIISIFSTAKNELYEIQVILYLNNFKFFTKKVILVILKLSHQLISKN